MKYRILASAVLLMGVLLMVGLMKTTTGEASGPILVQVRWSNPADLAQMQTAGVLVYVHLVDDGGRYLLAGATREQADALEAHGLDVVRLDSDMDGSNYYLAYLMPDRPKPDWEAHGYLLLDDGRQVLLRADPQDAERLAQAGVELRALTLEPRPLRPVSDGGRILSELEADPRVQAMIDQVDTTTIFSYTADLSGENPVIVGGLPFTIITRHTDSGEPIEKATAYVAEHLTSLGLGVEYHNWNSAGFAGRNVIGELVGETDPEDVFVICAHVDDMPAGSIAPGADDNASGSAAVLVAADILSQYRWDCTLRFALWTGEEQGLLGSGVYARQARDDGENIVGVLNLDMIAWDSQDTEPVVDLHARSRLTDSVAMANLFDDVVDTYGLDLVPEVLVDHSLGGLSDNASFWDEDYAAILAIEDADDFNENYHTITDTLQYLNMEYYTEFVKAAVSTFVHMADCLIPYQLYLPVVAVEG
jgi:hypothetical protein